ncbi:MAG TPA: hypothetical protein VN843_13660 [Anaerolineales bacterium]|nr:hypothetical protein [Anaerolineales bacterium]
MTEWSFEIVESTRPDQLKQLLMVTFRGKPFLFGGIVADFLIVRRDARVVF